jgi:zinc/manganese transport system substrate-binding protein
MLRILTCIGIALGVVSAASAEPLKVVATLPSFRSLAEEIGGDRVVVSSVAAPQFNAHFIEPKPSDVLRVKRAELFIHAGLDLEAWRGPLLDAAGNVQVRDGGERTLDLSQGIVLLNVPQGEITRAQGDIHLFGNPHYWSNPENGLIMARAIQRKLTELDPQGAEYFAGRGDDFASRLSKAIQEWRLQAQGVRGKGVVAYHDEWPYLTAFLGIREIGFLEPKPGIPPTPRQIELLTEKMKKDGVRVVIQATYSPDDSSKVLAQRVGGTVVKLCQNVGELPECEDYISMIGFNVRGIVQAFLGAS